MNIRGKFLPALLVMGFSMILTCGCSQAPEASSSSIKSRLRKSAPTPLPEPPYFLITECRFDPPPGEVICGDLFVLENRQNPDSPLISLHVAVFPTVADDPLPDPVIYLMGGAGGDALGAASFYVGAVGNQIRAERDFILYNQRGVKRNQPYLTCPGEKELEKQLTGLVHPEDAAEELEIDFLLECRDALSEGGIDLDQYNSFTNAADLVDLIHVLGYEQANIYGTSYGTRLGLTAMRYYPDSFRSAILDGVLPPQINFPSDGINSFITSLENLFAACKAQQDCQEKYPDLESDFYQVLENLQAEPALIDLDGSEVFLDHILFLDAIYLLLHPASEVPNTPMAIHNAARGEYSLLMNPIRNILGYSDFVATGVQYSSMCKDEILFESLEYNQEISSQYNPIFSEYLDLAFYIDICQQWITEPGDEIENTPVESSVPTLLLSGHFDSITTPAWAEDTAGYLETAYHYEFINMAHGTVRYDSCAFSIALNFLADPWSEPDASCLEEIQFPEFK
jgi:pimeloyl-ACP methyl ester carboxylesterase